MKTATVTIEGGEYAVPFAHLFPDLTEDEDAYLRESIGKVGVRSPVLTYDSPTHGPALIQGRNRVRIAAACGKKVPRFHFGPMDDATAELVSRDVQAAGRLLTPGAVERMRRVVIGAAANKSQRTLAAELGVNQSTINRDLARAASKNTGSGDAAASPEPKSEGEQWSAHIGGKSLGADGKTYRVAPKAPRPPEPPAIKDVRAAVPAVTRLQEAIEGVLAGPLGGAFRAALAEAGYPATAEGCWPPAVALAAALEVAAAG